MRLVATPNGNINQRDRAIWLTVPFDAVLIAGQGNLRQPSKAVMVGMFGHEFAAAAGAGMLGRSFGAAPIAGEYGRELDGAPVTGMAGRELPGTGTVGTGVF